MTLLVVQIPCHNEAASVGAAIASLPEGITGVDRIEILVIDDGSTDATAAVARAAGAHHILRLSRQVGLARAFQAGVEKSLSLGADFIVNFDGDHQYRGEDLPALLEPLLEGQADLVLGARPVHRLPTFGWLKRRLHVLGNALVRLCAGIEFSDATTGFRAFTRDTALRLSVHSSFTYTIETVIQAAQQPLRLAEIAVGTQPTPRTSRLAPTAAHYLFSSLQTVPRILLRYRPLFTLGWAGLILMIPGLGLALRFLAHYLNAGGAGRVQSLILAATLMLMGFGTILLGLLGDVVAGNRRLIEESLYRTRRLELQRALADRVKRRHEPDAARSENQ